MIAKKLYEKAERVFLPLNMMLELTYRCNERCLHCYLPETQGVRDPRAEEELTSAQWRRVLEELAEAGTLFLILTGGEVLLRKDLPEILRRARELYFSVEVFTNATLLTPEIADLWAELGVNRVGVSVYGPDAARHDRVTRLQGSFEAAMRGVRLLKERGIAVKLKTPLMRRNFSDYEALIALAQSLGAASKFDAMMAPRNDGADAPLRLGLKDGQLRRAYEDERLAPKEEATHARRLLPQEPTCGAGRTSGAINPFGEVLPCIQWGVAAGSVRKRPFGRIWREGRILIEARRRCAKDVKSCPKCGGIHFIHCMGLSQLEHGDPLVPDSGTCRISRTIQKIQGIDKK